MANSKEFQVPHREVAKQLRKRGCKVTRTQSREIWVAPNGMKIAIPHKNRALTRNDAQRMNAVLKACGLEEIRMGERKQKAAMPEVVREYVPTEEDKEQVRRRGRAPQRRKVEPDRLIDRFRQRYWHAVAEGGFKS